MLRIIPKYGAARKKNAQDRQFDSANRFPAFLLSRFA
jgi:hypothetical protein